MASCSLVKEDETGSDRLTEQIKALRRQLATELGFVMPPVRILDNMQLEPNDYKVKIKEVDAGHGQIYANQLMVMDPTGSEITLPGHHTTEPTFGLPATWIEPGLRDEAEMKGYSIIDPSTVISTHLTEVLKANVSDLLSYANVQSLLVGPQQGSAEARRGHRPRPDLDLRHPARAADAAHRAHLDPRPADHPRGHRRSRRRRPLRADDRRARPHAA